MQLQQCNSAGGHEGHDHPDFGLVSCIGFARLDGAIVGLFWDNAKENGNYYSIMGYMLGLYWDNGN